MSDLTSSLDRLEADFADAFECYGDGGKLSLAFFPLPDDAPEIGQMQLGTGTIPPESLPGVSWTDLYGIALITDHAEVGHRIITVIGGTARSSEPLRVFQRLSRRAGAVCFRLPRGMTATGPGNAPELNWVATLYAYLKGTSFVTEGAGFSTLRSPFAASIEVLSLMRRGDINGRAPTYTGSLRPGLPGVEGSATLRMEPVGAAPEPPPELVRNWLAEQYTRVPIERRGRGPSNELLSYIRDVTLLAFLHENGLPATETLAGCCDSSWIVPARVTVRTVVPYEHFPQEWRDLGLPVGVHEVYGIHPCVLEGWVQPPLPSTPAREMVTTPPAVVPSAVEGAGAPPLRAVANTSQPELVPVPSVTVAEQQQAKPPADEKPNDDQFSALRSLVRTLRLKGNEADAVRALCDGMGEVDLSVLTLTFGWKNPGDNWNSMRKRLNRKYRKHGWQFITHDNKAVAEPFGKTGRK